MYSLSRPTLGNLPVLACLNLINALAMNAIALDFPFERLYHEDCVSPFNLQGPNQQGVHANSRRVPSSLRPTEVQQQEFTISRSILSQFHV